MIGLAGGDMIHRHRPGGARYSKFDGLWGVPPGAQKNPTSRCVAQQPLMDDIDISLVISMSAELVRETGSVLIPGSA